MPLFGLPKLIKSVALNPNSPHRIKLPVNGGTYKRFIIRLFKGDEARPTQTTMHAAIKSISLEATRDRESFPIINGVDVNDIAFLISRYGAHNGVSIANGELMYNPSQVYGVDEYHRRTLNLGTMDLQDLTLNIHTNADLNSVARVEIYVIYDETDRQVLGAHRRIGFISPAIAAGKSGKMENIFMPEFDFRFGYAAIHFKLPAATTIGDFTQKRNVTQTDFSDVPVSIFEREDKLHRRTPQAGWKTLDYALADVPTAFLPAGFDSLQIEPNITAGPAADENMKVLYEVIELDVGLRKQLIGK